MERLSKLFVMMLLLAPDVEIPEDTVNNLLNILFKDDQIDIYLFEEVRNGLPDELKIDPNGHHTTYRAYFVDNIGVFSRFLYEFGLVDV